MHSFNKKPMHNHKRAMRDTSIPETCYTSSAITSPTAQSTFTLSGSTNIPVIPVKWNPACLKNKDLVDIRLYNRTAGTNFPNMLYTYLNVHNSAGEYNMAVDPELWGKASSTSLTVSIAPHDDLFPVSYGGFAPPPWFTVTYDEKNPPAAVHQPVGQLDTSGRVQQQEAAEKSLSKGKIAIGVLIPLLVIGLAFLAYVKFQRRKAEKQRREFSEKVDKRMSVVSEDWKSMSVGGAQAAIRASMARESAFIRPASSVYAPEVNGAGIGTKSGGYGMAMEGTGAPPDPMSPDPMSPYSPYSATTPDSSTGLMPRNDRSPGVGLRSSAYSNAQMASRVSRVSFADTVGTRPSGETRRSVYSAYDRKSRAFHQGHVPPMPDARALTPEEINRASSVYAHEGDDVGPALSMIRAQEEETEAQYAAMPSLPTPSYEASLHANLGNDSMLFTASPVVSTFPGFSAPSPKRQSTMPTPAVATSPDDLLKAYAEKSRSPPPQRSRTLDMGGLGGPAAQ